MILESEFIPDAPNANVILLEILSSKKVIREIANTELVRINLSVNSG